MIGSGPSSKRSVGARYVFPLSAFSEDVFEMRLPPRPLRKIKKRLDARANVTPSFDPYIQQPCNIGIVIGDWSAIAHPRFCHKFEVRPLLLVRQVIGLVEEIGPPYRHCGKLRQAMPLPWRLHRTAGKMIVDRFPQPRPMLLRTVSDYVEQPLVSLQRIVYRLHACNLVIGRFGFHALALDPLRIHALAYRQLAADAQNLCLQSVTAILAHGLRAR